MFTVFCGIESALGICNLQEIATAEPRLQALLFGAEDYAADVGAKRTQEGKEVVRYYYNCTAASRSTLLLFKTYTHIYK
jgi:citrate lyase beta subunit